MTVAIGIIWAVAALAGLAVLEAVGLTWVTVPVALIVVAVACFGMGRAILHRVDDKEV